MTLAALDAALGSDERILLETSSLIAFHSQAEAAHPLAAHLFRRIEQETDPLRGYYSAISATEILVRPLRIGMPQFTFMHAFLTTFPNLTVLPVDLTVATSAATLRALRNLPLPDALIIASGLLAGCDAIVTNDEAWKLRLEPLFREFRWLYLSDYR
jgi:predicted nucleic acid-binding protein